MTVANTPRESSTSDDMKKFLVLYGSSVPAREQIAKVPPEQAKAGMDLWTAWAKKAGHAIIDLGAPLGDAMRVEGGSTTSSASKVAGFSIVALARTRVPAATSARSA